MFIVHCTCILLVLVGATQYEQNLQKRKPDHFRSAVPGAGSLNTGAGTGTYKLHWMSPFLPKSRTKRFSKLKQKMKKAYAKYKGKSQKKEKLVSTTLPPPPTTTLTPEPDDIDKHLLNIMLSWVAEYLRDHKFFDFDHRFHDEEIEESSDDEEEKKPPPPKPFMRHFPLPRLRTLHPEAEKPCKQGFVKCLLAIFKVVGKSSYYKAKTEGKSVGDKIKDAFRKAFVGEEIKKTYLPFRSSLEQFKFRTTASYYMCWYTLKRYPLLKHFGRTCHQSLPGSDFRYSDAIPFGCALLSFCPDPCCGKVSRSGVVAEGRHCKQSPTNPCHRVHDGHCQHDFEHNHSFVDLMRNRINITCSCEKEKKGFQWSMKYRQCIDRDECYDGSHTCGEKQICRNTPGAYKCHCQRGYKPVNASACIRDQQQASAYDPEEDGKTSDDDATPLPIDLGEHGNRFVDQVLQTFGFSGVNRVLCDPSYLITLVIIGMKLQQA